MNDLATTRTLFGWVLPPAAVLAAIGLHWAINVPPGPLPPPGQKEDAPGKKADPKADRGKTKDEPKEPPEPVIPFTVPRSPGLLTQTWDAYEPVDFAKEPTFESWSAVHRPLITQIVTAARVHAFKDRTPAPSVSTSNVECHTVRCRFVMTSAEKADLDAMLEVIDGLQLGGATIWHKFLPDPVELEPSKRKGATPRNRVQVTASFIRDLPPLDALTLRDGTPLKSVPRPPQPPPVEPAQIPTNTSPQR